MTNTAFSNYPARDPQYITPPEPYIEDWCPICEMPYDDEDCEHERDDRTEDERRLDAWERARG